MKLKRTITDINAVPEALREYYTKDGENYILDADDSDLKDKVSEFRTNNIELRRKQEIIQSQLDAFKDIDPTKVPAAMEAMRKLEELEEQNLISEGKMDEVLAQRTERMRADYEGKTTALQDALGKATEQSGLYKGQLSDVLIDSRISQAMADVGVMRKGAITDILSRARRDWVVDEEGKLTPMRDGKVLYGKEATVPITPEEWGAGVYHDAPYLFEANAGGGSGGGSGGSGGHTGQVNMSDQAGLNANLEDIASGKVVVVDG